MLDLVILSAAKNLVLHRDVSSFLWREWEIVAQRKGKVWVLEDEILRYAQNDKVYLYPLHSTLIRPYLASYVDGVSE